MLITLLAFLITLWSLAPGPLREWRLPPDSSIIGYFGNGTYLATVSYREGYALSYWEARTGRLLRHLPSLTHPLNKRDFSPDGQYLAHVVRANDTWQLQITNLLNDQPDASLRIPLHDSMQQRKENNVYLAPAWAADSQRVMFRQEKNKQQTACLWDVQQRKLIFEQQSGIYNDPHIVVRFDTAKVCYIVMNATTGELLGEMPKLPTDNEFEFSAAPDGSAFMIVGNSAHPAKLIKFRFDLKTRQLSTTWEKDYGSGSNHIRYEASLRPPQYYLFCPSASKNILVHAGNGSEQEFHANLPTSWIEKNGSGFLRLSTGNGPGLVAVDGQGTRVISSDGRYLLYQTAEPVNTLFTQGKNWVSAKLGLKLDPSVSIVQFDLKQQTPMQHFDCNHPGLWTMILSPDHSHISFLHKHQEQLYLRQWAVPFPGYPWWLILMLSGLAGLYARISPGIWSRRKAVSLQPRGRIL